MRYDGIQRETHLWLRMGEMTVVKGLYAREYSVRKLRPLDPAVVGKAIQEMTHLSGNFSINYATVGLEEFRETWKWTVQQERIREAVGRRGSVARTSARITVHSDGNETAYWVETPAERPDALDNDMKMYAVLSSRPPYHVPTDASIDDMPLLRRMRDDPHYRSSPLNTHGRWSERIKPTPRGRTPLDSPLLITEWRDPEMLGHVALMLFEQAGPPIGIELASLFDAPEPKRRTALHKAARDGVLEELPPAGRKAPRNLDGTDASGATALMLAAGNGHADAVARLVEVGADPGLQDDRGRTALHYAAESGHAGAARTLLGAGADSSIGDGIGDTALHLAAARGRTDAVKALLEAGAPPDARDAAYAATALHKAARGGHLDAARLLMEAGADVKAANEGGRTALHIAASHGDVDMTLALLAAGADVRQCDGLGRTALHSPVFYQHLECVEALLAHGAEAGVRDEEGNTPLHVAAAMNRDRAARLLMDAGAEVDALNSEGLTPLDLATANQHLGYRHAGSGEHNSEAAEVLLDAGASLDPLRLPVGDRHPLWPNLTPKEFLRKDGNLDYSKLPDLPDWYTGRLSSEARSYQGKSLLHDAVVKRVRGLTRRLLESGALPETARDESPLLDAIKSGDYEVAGLLLDWGRDDALLGPTHFYDRHIHRREVGDVTPLDYALTMRDAGMMRLILERGAPAVFTDFIPNRLVSQSQTVNQFWHRGWGCFAEDAWWYDREGLGELLLQYGFVTPDPPPLAEWEVHELQRRRRRQ